ncbi:hypothetical protein THRCLA_02674 [Thraustotheca clavata]|uniref:Peptidase M12A domain-containing protein n=1 Tax=Thraustotheca clavata TaxID=74557 RepID=A0A1W0A4C6_9STRA|nr:hypothetical protein THRCLA_02674 [Thraustotheca clavata]
MWRAIVLAAIVAKVHAKGFFVCPAPCEAMFLPQDMESTEDCLCLSTQGKSPSADNKLSMLLLAVESTMYRCPKDSVAKVLHPKAFTDCECKTGLDRDERNGFCVQTIQCTGKYILRPGVTEARSIADCNCQEPYTKDDATGECFLDHCPRSANYVKKAALVGPVHSLADCDCLDPFTKNPQSGECFLQFQCPLNSSPPKQGYAKSLVDCTCDWGFVHNLKASTSSQDVYCVPQKPSFICPPHSRPLATLTGAPLNFLGCECAVGYERDEKLELCKEDKNHGNPVTIPPEFICPDYSIPMAPHPYSMRQCQCLPGFVPNYGMQSCDWSPDFYKCPLHSFNPYPSLPALDFMDCRCAKGFVRNDYNASCDEKPPLNENGCPMHALINRWPVHDPNTDCMCQFGSEHVQLPPPAMIGAEFQAHVNKALKLQGNESLLCSAPLATDMIECPTNAIMNNWPLTKLSDCSCKSGYILQAIPSATDPKVSTMACVPTPSSLRLPPCGPGMKRSISDNSCRYIGEEALSVSKTLGKIVINGNELDYVLVEDDVMVTQGDIAVGISFGFFEDDHLFYILHGYYNMEKDNRWKDSKMCFTISHQVSKRRDDILYVMNHITTNTGFTFLECHEAYCDDHINDCDDFVDFTPTESSCYSFIGRVGGRQALGISDDCGRGNLIHVLLHAIGLHHPIVRPDRDAHTSIAWECIEKDKRSFFAIEHLEEIYGKGEVDMAITEVPYDYYSIMHHRADAFVNASLPGCLSLIPRIEDVYARQEVLNEMGQRDKMSLTDIHYVWVLYPELKQAHTSAPPIVNASIAEDFTSNETDPPALYHESRLHTKADAIDNHASSTTSTVGAVVCVVGLLALLGFGLVEMKRVSKRHEENHGKYADPLLSDPIYD